MLARAPWIPPLRTAAKPKRLSKEKRRAIRDKIVVVMRMAEPTPFAAEGPCRHGVRSSLCLQGWGWAEADVVATEIVRAALGIVGAKRPTWQAGQPEYTQPGALPILRERCIRCRKPLPEGHWKFCSDVCNAAYHSDLARRRRGEELDAMAAARKAAWSAKQPNQACEQCGAMFRPRKPGQRFCRQQCAGSFYGGRK